MIAVGETYLDPARDGGSSLSDGQVRSLVRHVTEYLGQQSGWRRDRTEPPKAGSRLERPPVPGIREIRVVDAADLNGASALEERGLVLVVVTQEARRDAPADAAELRQRFRLTPRQAEVALLLANRRTNKEIARELGIARHTARRHTEAVLRKLGVHDRNDVHRVLVAD